VEAGAGHCYLTLEGVGEDAAASDDDDDDDDDDEIRYNNVSFFPALSCSEVFK
jgi:hypothetical protein